MGRIAGAALLAFVPLLAAVPPRATGEPRPPSSLEPQEARALVTFTHVPERVAECATHRGKGTVTCEAKRERTFAGTSLVLEPVAYSGTLSDSDRRKPVKVRFDDDPGPQVQKVEVAVGTWEIKWGTLRPRPRLQVGEDDDPSIGLSTVAGSCRKVATRCQLSPDGIERTVSIPARYQAP